MIFSSCAQCAGYPTTLRTLAAAPYLAYYHLPHMSRSTRRHPILPCEHGEMEGRQQSPRASSCIRSITRVSAFTEHGDTAGPLLTRNRGAKNVLWRIAVAAAPTIPNHFLAADRCLARSPRRNGISMPAGTYGRTPRTPATELVRRVGTCAISSSNCAHGFAAASRHYLRFCTKDRESRCYVKPASDSHGPVSAWNGNSDLRDDST